MKVSVEESPPEVSFPESREERALFDCHLAQQHEDRGEYEQARLQLSLFWPTFAEDPDLTGLGPVAKGRLLRRVGALTGRLGRINQLPAAQERAKDLLTLSLEVFQSLEDRLEVVETKYELASCYWREGAFDEARIVINSALSLLTEVDGYWEGKLLVRAATIEWDAQRLQESLRLLRRAEGKIGKSDDVLLRGNLHSGLGLVLSSLFLQEEAFGAQGGAYDSDSRKQYLQFALHENLKARELFEQASHKSFVAHVENNIGNLFYSLGRYDEAHKYLCMALRRLRGLKELGNAAQVLESLANVYLARGESEKALLSAREAVSTFKRGDDRALLSEALVTLGKVYARLGQSRRARKAIAQAVDTSELAGDTEGAGSAALTLLEELFEDLTAEERQGIYTRAEVLLSRPMNPANVARLREMSLRVGGTKSHRGSLHFIELPQQF